MKLQLKKTKIYTIFSYLVRPQYQLIALIITAGIILLMLHYAMSLFRPFEKRTQLLPITPKIIQEWGGEPTIVSTGLFVTNWHEFNVQDNIFVFDGVVWFQFDPALIALDTIDQFTFEKGEILKKSKPDTKLIDGVLFAEYEIRLRFTTNLIHRLFPLDDHRIYIGMINTYVAPSEVVFKVNKASFGESENVFIPDWKMVDHDVESGYEEQIIDKYDARKNIRVPKVIYELDFRRSGVSLIMLILLPLFLIFFFGLFSFAFDPATSIASIVGIATTALTSLVAYRFVIQSMSPKVGYFLLSDIAFMLFLGLTFFVFIVGVGIVKAGGLQQIIVNIRGMLFVLFHIVIIGAWYYLLFYWV